MNDAVAMLIGGLLLAACLYLERVYDDLHGHKCDKCGRK